MKINKIDINKRTTGYPVFLFVSNETIGFFIALRIMFYLCCIVAGVCRANKECEKDDEYYYFPFHFFYSFIYMLYTCY